MMNCHSIALLCPSILIGRYPVTVAQFAAFISATHYKPTAEQHGFGWNWDGGGWMKSKVPIGSILVASKVTLRRSRSSGSGIWYDAQSSVRGLATSAAFSVATERSQWEKATTCDCR